MNENVSLLDNDIQLELLPLKARHEDVFALMEYYISVAEEQLGTGYKELSKEVREYILSRGWDGDEKALEKAVKRACVLSDEQVLKIEDFNLKYRQIKSMGIGKFVEEKLKGFMKNIKNLEKFNLYETVMPEVEKALITMVIKETKGNQIKAAKLLGINRNTLRDKIKKLKIKIKS